MCLRRRSCSRGLRRRWLRRTPTHDGRATARCSPSPPAKKALTRLFRWRWRASRSCAFIIESGAAHDQVANRAEDRREILADLKVLETKDDDSSRQQLSIT